jgi:cell division protein FtsB
MDDTKIRTQLDQLTDRTDALKEENQELRNRVETLEEENAKLRDQIREAQFRQSGDDNE